MFSYPQAVYSYIRKRIYNRKRHVIRNLDLIFNNITFRAVYSLFYTVVHSLKMA